MVSADIAAAETEYVVEGRVWIGLNWLQTLLMFALHFLLYRTEANYTRTATGRICVT